MTHILMPTSPPPWVPRQATILDPSPHNAWEVSIPTPSDDIRLSAYTPGGYHCDSCYGPTPREAIEAALRYAHRSFLDALDEAKIEPQREAAIRRHIAHVTALEDLYRRAPYMGDTIERG